MLIGFYSQRLDPDPVGAHPYNHKLTAFCVKNLYNHHLEIIEYSCSSCICNRKETKTSVKLQERHQVYKYNHIDRFNVLLSERREDVEQWPELCDCPNKHAAQRTVIPFFSLTHHLSLTTSPDSVSCQYFMTYSPSMETVGYGIQSLILNIIQAGL
jgi:hypothetical protein